MKRIYPLILLLSISLHLFSQGKTDGFYRGNGNSTAVMGFGYEDPKNYFAGREKLDLGRNIFYANLYYAYGLNDDLDAQVSIPYLISDDNKDFQDISVFFKYRILQKELSTGSLQLSLGAGVSTPLGNYTVGGLNDLGQRATILDARAVIHYQCNKNWFYTLQSGFSYKLEEVPNSIPFVLKIGKASQNWYYDVFYDYQYSFGGDDYLGSPRPQNFREFGVDYHKVGGTVFTPISDNLGIYGSYSYILAGRNTFQGPSYGVGLTYNFKRKE